MAKTSTVKNRADYPSRFLVNYIEDDLNPLRIKMMEEFSWTKVSTVAYNQDVLVSVRDNNKNLYNATFFFDYVRFIFNNSTSFSYTKLSFNKKILDIKARKVFFIIYSLLISKADVFRNENHAFEIKVVSFI